MMPWVKASNDSITVKLSRMAGQYKGVWSTESAGLKEEIKVVSSGQHLHWRRKDSVLSLVAGQPGAPCLPWGQAGQVPGGGENTGGTWQVLLPSLQFKSCVCVCQLCFLPLSFFFVWAEMMSPAAPSFPAVFYRTEQSSEHKIHTSSQTVE